MTEDHKALKAAADEFYRETLVDWMAAHDISTGVSVPAFEDLLKVIGCGTVRWHSESTGNEGIK